MPDTFDTIGQTRIQHGPESDRIYVMHLADEDMPEIIGKLETLAGEKDYSKIFAKVPGTHRQAFERAGYTCEAHVPNFFYGTENGCFMSRFLDPSRAEAPDRETIDSVLAAAKEKMEPAGEPGAVAGYTFRACTEDDLEPMAELFKIVFESYPFPIHDPEYLRKTMRGDTRYYGAWTEAGALAAVSSAETYPKKKNVEMTDFATHPDHRGQGLAQALLPRMDAAMAEAGFKIGYTIARAVSYGMNITFARCGYEYAGTLINNTQISGRIESMNIWYRPLGA
jgi:beta-lysine N6-acetyltransferase